MSPELEQRLAQLSGAEVAVVMPALTTTESLREAVALVRRALDGLAPENRTVVAHPDGALADPAHPTDGAVLLPLPFGAMNGFPGPGQHLAEMYRAVFRLSHRLGVRACALVGSDPALLSADALRRLVAPVLEQNFDLITPLYLRGRFEGLLLSAVVAPLVRALYGRRILFPLGADVGMSSRLVERQLALPPAGRDGLPVWLPTDAVCAGLQVGQAQLGIPLPVRRDPPEVSEVLVQVLGPLFLDLERNAASWQKVRGSQSVPVFGPARWLVDEPGTVEVGRMIDTFRLGYRDLQGLWSGVLPPATLVELKRLTVPAPAFRLPDELWARIVYDFALAHRLRIMSRDHLIRAMTPLYLAWVASYADEVATALPLGVEYRLEQVGAAFEAQKPYLVSRWRWPDRFIP
ncbi:MAG TPA: hypothetical protein VFZ26_17210 [Gemmatimonadales bacterium]